jgi:nitric oxide reductase subunit C
MTKKNARLIFWTGTLISAAIFAWLTLDFHKQGKILANADKIGWACGTLFNC